MLFSFGSSLLFLPLVGINGFSCFSMEKLTNCLILFNLTHSNKLSEFGPTNSIKSWNLLANSTSEFILLVVNGGNNYRIKQRLDKLGNKFLTRFILTNISEPPFLKAKSMLMSMTNYYNYHDYHLNSPNGDIIITHHPNPYPFSKSIIPPIPEFSNKSQLRVVRIPRLTAFDYPQFSNILSRNSNDTEDKFNGSIEFNSHYFSNSCTSPLTNYLDQKQFEEIVNSINNYLVKEYNYDSSRIIFTIINLLSFGLLNYFTKLISWNSSFKQNSNAIDLDNYISNINKKFSIENINVRLVNPKLSGFLSLDWIIPDPV